jgi:hypothetical protein
VVRRGGVFGAAAVAAEEGTLLPGKTADRYGRKDAGLPGWFRK